MSTVELTDANFEETVTKGGVVLVDFWAEWCGPCKAFAPTYSKVSEQFPDVVFGKLDTEANRRIAAREQIQSIPTIMAFRDGIRVYRHSGLLPAGVLTERVQQVLALDMDEVRQAVAEAQAKAQQQG